MTRNVPAVTLRGTQSGTPSSNVPNSLQCGIGRKGVSTPSQAPKHSGAEPQEPRTWRPTRSPKDTILASWIQRIHNAQRERIPPPWYHLAIHILTKHYIPNQLGLGILTTDYGMQKLMRRGGIWPSIYHAWRKLDGQLDIDRRITPMEDLTLPINRNKYFLERGQPLQTRGEQHGLSVLGNFFIYHQNINRYRPFYDPDLLDYVVRFIHVKHQEGFYKHYIKLSTMWRLGQLTLAPNLWEALSYRMPAFTDSRIFPTHNLKLGGVNIKLYSIKFGRLYQISPDPVAVTREWAHITSYEGAWRRAWKSWPRRPSEPKQKILRWRLLQHKLITTRIAQHFDHSSPNCKRCSIKKIFDKPWTNMQNYEKLFGFHEETQGKDRQVSMLLHDIMVWSIHKTRIAIVMDNQEHEDIAFKCIFLSDLLIAIKGQWIQAQRKKDEEGFKQKWGKSSLIQIDDCQELQKSQNTLTYRGNILTPRLPLYHCHLAGRPVAEYSTRQDRHSQRNSSLEPNTLVPRSWPEVGSTPKDWEKVWISVH
ncbi:uncharacterized protein VTP21DRAFT_6533 [Calcarisporiella thermophila]|uniref:uncharacterized protein n=1 Tax=Calcarisporiella thermophila TaxID=911321 RepID=UPI003743F14B